MREVMAVGQEFAFVGHGSAVEAWRFLARGRAGAATWQETPRWPSSPRPLPGPDACVSNQRGFKAFAAECDLSAFGIESAPVDLLVSCSSCRSGGKGATFHVLGGPVPAGSFARLNNRLLLSSPELTVIQFCGAQGRLMPLMPAFVESTHSEQAVGAMFGVDRRDIAIDHPLRWESKRRLIQAAVLTCEFAGTYRLAVGEGTVAYGVDPIMSLASLREAADALTPSQATRRATSVCGLAFDGSASPRETSLALMLTLPIDFGGFGIKKPQLNARIDASEHDGVLADREVVTPDFLWADEQVALEYDSAEFHAERGATQVGRDAARSNILAALGYRVFRATPQVTGSLAAVSLLARQVSAALGVPLEPIDGIQQLRREKLYLMLFAGR